MTIAASRIQLTQSVYMPLDGQWQVVLPGTVIDLPANVTISPAHAVVLAEAPGQLGAHGKHTSVRNVRTAA